MKVTKSTVYRMPTLATAKLFASSSSCPMIVVIGDDEEVLPYMVVTPADASRLQRAGYSLA